MQPSKLVLSEVAGVFNGKTPTKAEHRDVGHPVLKIKDVTADGLFAGRCSTYVDSEVANKFISKFLQDNDILILNAAHNASHVASKMWLATNEVAGALPTGEWLVIRANTQKTLPEYLFYWLHTVDGKSKLRFLVKGIHLYPKDVAQIEIPYCSLDEQRRIVDILKRADGIRRLRKQAIQTARELIPALFVDMFGDPATNPRGWAVQPLGDLVDVVSGATPSKKRSDYWIGNIPWVSPKDMKVEDISDSEDHLAESVLSETNIKMIPRESVLVVVRGMILVHTVPIRINSVPVTINQDMKALIPKGVRAAYLRWALQSMHETLLKKVTTAGHGTRKLDTEHLVGMMIGVPPLALQDEFKERVNAAASIVGQHNGSREYMERLFQGLLHRAFRGKL